jgi:CRISPR-associated endonuclease/helicase Cas3
VFDEADFYDPFVQANLTVLIHTLNVLKVPVLIMSATVPDSAGKLYGVNSSIGEPEGESITPGRALVWAGKAQKAKEVEAILQQMIEKGTGILYANTVERALSYYTYFKQNPGAPEPILYHSRFTEPDKKLIEEKLLNALGREAWEKNTAKGIAILTQIGEMSINISASIMLSDVCPWDRLAQRVGRLNRFAKDDQGIAYIVAPHKKGELYVAPYGSLENRKWIPAQAFTDTYDQLKEKLEGKGIVPITSGDFVKYVNSLYPDLPDFSIKARTNKESLLKLMNQNWLIVPDRKTDEEAGTVSAEWSSRNIEAHKLVSVTAPEDFDTYEDYQAFALEYGVSCPVWMINKELKKPDDQRRITSLVRRVNDEQMTFLYTDSYNSVEGMSFFYTSDDQEDDEY